MIMTRQERPWSKQSGESMSSRASYLRDLFSLSDARQALFIYIVGMSLLIFGGIYALWRISLLSEYLSANRAYVLERDERWEKHIQGQAEVTREILRRLPERR
jgi:hypothetical protein